jgi:hypothetical protein
MPNFENGLPTEIRVNSNNNQVKYTFRKHNFKNSLQFQKEPTNALYFQVLFNMSYICFGSS